MRIAVVVTWVAVSLALAGCAAEPPTTAPVAVIASPTPVPVAPVADLLPPEDPAAVYPVEITVPLDHVVSIDEAVALADAWGLTPVNFTYANGCVAGQFAASRIESAGARILENFGTEPQIVSFSVEYRVVDVFDYASYPHLDAQPTGRSDDFAATPASCG